jgi:phosphoribosyl 1,2-cyclic phosphodiesterase
MRFAILGSGSKGNSVVVQAGDARSPGTMVLVDVGYAPKETRKRLRGLDLELKDTRALLVTHGHGDHVKGARPLARALGISTHCTEETHRFCAFAGGLENREPFVAGDTFRVGDLTVHAIRTPHDANGSVCFFIDDGVDRLGIVTDLGKPTLSIGDALADCTSIIVEHNHDRDMLMNGPYPLRLKRRVGSEVGHLKNEDGARLVAHAVKKRVVTKVLLAHLSEVNNTPAKALAACRPAVDGMDIEVAVAPQHHPTGWLRARKSPGGPLPATRAGATKASVPVLAPEPLAVAAPAASARHVALERQLTLFEPAVVRGGTR